MVVVDGLHDLPRKEASLFFNQLMHLLDDQLCPGFRPLEVLRFRDDVLCRALALRRLRPPRRLSV